MGRKEVRELLKKEKELREQESLAGFRALFEEEGKVTKTSGGRSKTIFETDMGAWPGKTKDWFKKTKSKSSIPWYVRIFLSAIIVIQAFFPFWLYTNITIPFSLLLIGIGIGIVIAALTGVFWGAANIIFKIVISIIVVLMVIGFVQSFGSPNYFKALTKGFVFSVPNYGGFEIGGEIFALVSFLITFSVTSVLAWKISGNLSFIVFLIVLFATMFFILPYVFGEVLPLITPLRKEVSLSQAFPTVTIPVGGGINVLYGTEATGGKPATMLAGEPYIYYYSIKNNYNDTEKVNFAPFIKVTYGSAEIKFLNPSASKKDIVIQSGKAYQDEILYNPEDMTTEAGKSYCFYSKGVIAYYNNINESDVECASNKLSCPEKSVCANIGSFMCKCINWFDATCNGTSARLGMDVNHTGYLLGKAILYYYKEFYKTITLQKFVQGPIYLQPVLLPNPWIEKIYNPTKDSVTLYAEMGISSGEATVSSISVTPVNTIIRTSLIGYSSEIDEFVNVTIEEELGLSLKSCETISDLKMEQNIKYFKKLCVFSPPTIKTTIKETKVLNISEEMGTPYEDMQKYCSGDFEKNLETITEKQASEEFKAKAKGLVKLIGNSELCKLIEDVNNKKQTNPDKLTFIEKQLDEIQRTINVMILVNYTRSYTDMSQPLNIFRGTETCLKGLFEETTTVPTTTPSTTLPPTTTTTIPLCSIDNSYCGPCKCNIVNCVQGEKCISTPGGGGYCQADSSCPTTTTSSSSTSSTTSSSTTTLPHGCSGTNTYTCEGSTSCLSTCCVSGVEGCVQKFSDCSRFITQSTCPVTCGCTWAP